MISHKNICSVISNIKYRFKLNEHDSYISYLPMAHILERCIFNSLIFYQVKVGVYSGDIHLLMEDIKVLKPTIFVTVPRIFNKIYDSINSKLSRQNSLLK